MINNKKYLHILMPLILCFAACANRKADSAASSFRVKGDTVYVYRTESLVSRIKLSDVEVKPYSKEVITAGTVQPIPTQFACIAPPFAGRIVKSHIKLGQKTAPGMALFEISSPDFTAAQKDFFKALSEKELAQKELKRKDDLLRNGVGTQRELEEAVNILQIADKEYGNAYAALQVYRIDPERMTLGQPLVVCSPISGHVIKDNIVTGQYVRDDAEPIATVADLSQVWIAAQVKEKDIRFIHEGDDMEMHVLAFPGKTIRGKVFRIEETVDDDTRSIRVLSVCDNRDGLLKMGMYTTVYFFDQPSDFVHIPEKALLQGERDSFVYVETAPDTYVRTPVEVEITKDGTAVIAKGLDPGCKIISEGGYYLK